MKELESSMELNDFMHMAIGQEIVNGRMENRHSEFISCIILPEEKNGTIPLKIRQYTL